MRLTSKIASGLGSALEWYDFAVYGYFARIFAQQFFPPHTHFLVGLMASFSVFAIGFAARPLGGVLFGIYGDKYGRLPCLQLTPILITIPSVLIALLPSYVTLGLVAPVLLVLLRIVQGICIGGEFAGNIIYLCEYDLDHRYLVGSLAGVMGGLGILLASLVAVFLYRWLSAAQINAFGWRIAFFLSAVVGSIAYLIRRQLIETPIYQRLQATASTSTTPLRDALLQNKQTCLAAVGILFLHANSFYFIFMFLPTFLTSHVGLKADISLFHNNILLLANLLLSPLLGLIAQQIGGRPLLLIASLCYLFLSVPLFHLICAGHAPDTYLALWILALLTTLNAGAAPGLLIELLPAPTRYTTFATAFNISFGLFGGSMPLLAYFLIHQTGVLLAPAYYLAGCAFITLITLMSLKTHKLTD
jgi:MHS family proline/betaine transporter-like MFS transporter